MGVGWPWRMGLIAYFFVLIFLSFTRTGSFFIGSSMLLSLFAGEGIFLEVFNCRCGIGRRRERSRKGKRELSGGRGNWDG